MKVEYKQPEFTPITLIIESQAELDALWIGMNSSSTSFRSNALALTDITPEVVNSAASQHGNIWRAINQVRCEIIKP